MYKCTLETPTAKSEIEYKDEADCIQDYWDFVVKPALLGIGYSEAVIETFLDGGYGGSK